MRLIYRVFRQDPDSREGIITVTSGIGVAVNLFVALLKVIVGVIASSIAIISEGINNATDALTSVLALVGTKLAGKHPDEKHPFGYGRIEYLTSLVISLIILVGGVELLISSVKLVFEPAELSISYLSLILVAVSAVIKFLLGCYTVKMGEKADSGALIGVGKDSKNDCIASLITIISALVFLIFDYSIDAYAGIITSLLIIKAGIEVLRDTVSELIGRPGETELAKKLYKEIRSTPGILAAVDMMLHNYGPDAYSGSVNVEIDHEMTVGETYQFLHELQLKIMHEYNVTMVFGVYAVDNDHVEVKQLRNDITAFKMEEEYVKSFHAVYIEPETNRIYVDFIVDYKLRDWNSLRNRFITYMADRYPEKEVVLTLETEFV